MAWILTVSLAFLNGLSGAIRSVSILRTTRPDLNEEDGIHPSHDEGSCYSTEKYPVSARISPCTYNSESPSHTQFRIKCFAKFIQL
jgi:hypothetical protein